jgi:hypothetical protein
LPFWHTTVVVLPGGTTTVVFAGGGGLELLTQPAKNIPATIALSNAFIVDSYSCNPSVHCDRLMPSGAGACTATGCRRAPTVPNLNSYRAPPALLVYSS